MAVEAGWNVLSPATLAAKVGDSAEIWASSASVKVKILISVF
jgi:hypothetical protein